MSKALTHRQAAKLYNRIGRAQDLQSFYEAPALQRLVRHGRFGEASHVVELGCGTGALAAQLLRDRLPEAASYLALDVSSTMCVHARERLEPWSHRARVVQTGGDIRLPVPDGSADRVVSTYVLDLLSDRDLGAFLAETRRALRAGGLLAVVGLTPGLTPRSRLVSRTWSALHRAAPAVVGGCRPRELVRWIGPPSWTLEHHSRVCPYGICSEIVVARPS